MKILQEENIRKKRKINRMMKSRQQRKKRAKIEARKKYFPWQKCCNLKLKSIFLLLVSIFTNMFSMERINTMLLDTFSKRTKPKTKLPKRKLSWFFHTNMILFVLVE